MEIADHSTEQHQTRRFCLHCSTTHADQRLHFHVLSQIVSYDRAQQYPAKKRIAAHLPHIPSLCNILTHTLVHELKPHSFGTLFLFQD